MKALFFCFLLLPGYVFAQQDQLYHVGLISAFVGGVYDGFYSYRALGRHGDFGLGAPDKLDGEITILNGKAYHFRHTGKNTLVKDSEQTCLAFVNFFHSDQAVTLHGPLTKDSLFAQIDSLLHDANGMFAIKISGTFKYVRTRAFPAQEKPYPPVNSILNKQQFFEYANTRGTFVGYKLPVFMNGFSVPGYHFHFLSDDLSGGGHVTEFTATDVKVEIDRLHAFTVAVPDIPAYRQFNFSVDQTQAIRNVETGKKQ